MHCFKRVLFPILFYYCSSKCCNDCLCEYFIICTMLNHFLLHCIKLVETFPYCSIIVGSFRDIFFLKQQYIWRIIPKCHVNEVQAFKNQVTLICVSRCLQFYTRCNSYGHITGGDGRSMPRVGLEPGTYRSPGQHRTTGPPTPTMNWLSLSAQCYFFQLKKIN